MGVIFKNNVMYGAGDIEISPVCYSEEEREIGVWTDGKPLYQKMLIFTAPSSSSYTQQPLGISGYDSIIIDYSTTFAKTATASTTLGMYGNGTVYNDSFIGLLNVQANTLDYRVGSSYYGATIYLTLLYTKTTDTPGAGTWTPSGVPAVHYSTDEHIVGTWVDGGTLYEITKQLSSPAQIASQGVEIDFGSIVADIDLVIDAKALRSSSSQYGTAASSVFVRKASGATTKLTFYSGVSFSGAEYITIQYTKSA